MASLRWYLPFAGMIAPYFLIPLAIEPVPQPGYIRRKGAT